MQAYRKQVEALPSADELIASFKSEWIKPLRKNTNKHLPFLQQLSFQKKKEINQKIRQIDLAIRELFYLGLVNDQLKSLARRGVDLHVAVFSQDKKRLKRLVRSFLREPHTSLHSVVPFVSSSSLQLDILEKLYHDVLESLQQELPLEHHVQLLDGEHKKALSNLKNLQVQQKKLVSQVGGSILSKLRQLSKEKKYKKCFAK